MSIQTRLQRKSNRSVVNLKCKDEATFFSEACKQLTKIKSKRLKKSVKKDVVHIKQEQQEISEVNEVDFCFKVETEDSPEIDSCSNYIFGSSNVPRASLFEKLQMQKHGSTMPYQKFHPPFELQSSIENVKGGTKMADSVAVIPPNRIKQLSQEYGDVKIFMSEVLKNVSYNVKMFYANDDPIELPSTSENKTSDESNDSDKIPLKIFEKLPIYGESPENQIKRVANQYLDTFLEKIDRLYEDELDHQRSDYKDSKIKSSFSGLESEELCSFGDSLFDEGFISKPLEQQYQCPWPSIDRCLLSSEVENKNFGNIFVVRHQKRPRQEEPLKRRRSFMFSQPPKYITPVEYHNRTMEHIEHMERLRWQSIVKSHDYEGLYYGLPPSKIPDYIYHNETKQALSTNSELLNYMDIKVKNFPEDVWQRVDFMARASSLPIAELSPYHVDSFFCQFFFFSAGFSRQSRKRKRNYLLKYFQPELYMPHHRYNPLSRENSFIKLLSNEKLEKISEPSVTPASSSTPDDVVKENVPTLPEIPTRACVITSTKSPELRTVENVYSFKKKTLNLT